MILYVVYTVLCNNLIIIEYSNPCSQCFGDKTEILFQLEDKNLVRTPYSNGKKGASVKIPHSIKTSGYVNVMIAVTADAVTHSFFAQQQWRAVDKWETPGGGTRGKFALHIPGRDQIGVSDFRFTPN